MHNWFTSVVQGVVYPFQVSGDWMVHGVGGAWDRYLWLINVAEENERLHAEVKQLKDEKAATEELRIAYDRLLGMLQFDRSNLDQKIFASVVGERQDSFSKLLIINRGSNQGVKKNFSVVTQLGVVGKIQSATPFQAVVQLITDARSHFPALVQRTRLKVMVQGELDGSLVISNFPRRMSVKLGDMVVTSGLAGIFPKGLPIGIVSHIEKKEFGLFQHVTLTPSARLNQLEELSVILHSRSNIHQPLFTEGD